MKKDAWKRKIKKACEQAGTYRPFFDSVILTLASILEKRDQVEKMYLESGGEPIVRHTNQGGNTNITKNPALILWDDLNKSALAYWRDLGLTPAGLKKIDEGSMKAKKQQGFADVLANLEI